jgi:alpha-1,2-mannosyltransferase
MRRLVAAVLALETGVGCLLISLLVSQTSVPAGSDYAVYYAGARALRLDPAANLYQWSVIQSNMSPVGACRLSSPFVYPPLLAILFEPLTLLPCATAVYIWEGITALLLTGALFLLGRMWPLRAGTFTLVCGATLMSFPLVMGLYYGQIHVLILFGLVLALWRYQRGDWLGTGIAIAIVAWIQVIPGLFVIFFLLRREWRVVFTMLGVGALLLLGMVLLLGPQWVPDYLFSIQHTSATFRVSYNACLVDRYGLWGAFLVLAVYVTVLARFSGDLTVGFLWTIATMILMSPIAWQYFLLWLMPAFLIWWLRGTGWLRALIIALYIALYFSKAIIAIQEIVMIVCWMMIGWDYVRSATVAERPLSVATTHERPATDLAG